MKNSPFTQSLLRLSALALRDSRPKIANQEVKESLNVIIQEIDKNHVQTYIELGNIKACANQLRETANSMK
jgi:hypothetical protein